MFERFTRTARQIVTDGHDIARELGASAVEAEHLLLALARHDEPALLAEGLDYDRTLAALEREEERSLACAGIAAAPLPRVASQGKLPFARSTRAALEQSLKAAVARREREITDRHVLLGVLAPARGTVPRALELAGVDREALRRTL